MAGTVFPAIIKASYDPSGGFPKMVEDARRTSIAIRDSFERDFAKVGDIVKNSLKPPLASGKIDLGLGELKTAAAEARTSTLALEQLQRTTTLLAIETGDTSRQTQAYIQTIGAQIIASKNSERAIASEIATYSRLQAALSASESSVSNLASAYRNLEKAKYAQAAADAKSEAAGNRFRGNFDNALLSAGVGASSGKSAAASAEVFAEFDRASDAAKKYAADLEELRRSELGASKAAALLGASMRGTALDISHTSKSARESANIFIEAEREQQRAVEERRRSSALAAAEREREQAELAASASALRSQLDPLYAAQKRFDDELRNADRLLNAGSISAREYAAAQALARTNLQQANDRIHQQALALKQGTDAYGIHAQSLRGSRQAMVQTGQQLQDLAISLYSGQRATTVFAQQLPQLAFALTSLEGSANKTSARIGAFAAMLSGPLGSVALVAASVGLGILVEKLLSSGDAADDASKAHETLAQKLDLQRNSYEAVIKATREYNAEQERSRELTLDSARAVAIEAQANIKAAIAIREKLAAQLAAQNQTALGSAGQGFGGATSSALGRAGVLENRILENAEELADLTKAAENAVVGVATEMAKINSDPRYAIENRFNALRNSATASIKDVTELTRRLTELNNQEKAALDTLKENSRARAERLPDVTGQEIAKILGTSITSGKRTKAQNKAAGGSENSYHLTGQAIDIPLTVNGRPLTKEGIRAELEAAGVIIKELLGPGDKGHNDHFHIAFAKRRGTPDQLEKAQARAMEAAARETERLSRVSDSAAESILRISSQYDEQPRLIDRIKIALDQLEDVRKQVLDPKNMGADGKSLVPGAEQLLADVEKAKAIVGDGINIPLRKALQNAREQAAVEQLLIEGREFEAEILSRILDLQREKGPLTQAEAETVADIVAQERLRSIELEKQRLLQQRALDIVNRTQDNVRSTIRELLEGKGFGAIGNFIKRGFDTYLDGLADQFAESLFGDVFRQQRMKILGLDKVDEAGQEMAKEINQSARALDILTEAAMGASRALSNVAANDNPAAPGSLGGSIAALIGANQDIVVNGRRTSYNVDDVLNRTLKGLSTKVFGEKFTNQITGALKGVMQGAALGQASSGILKSLGIKQSKLGSQIGGAIGGAIGGPIGSLIGGALGGTIGGLFKKTPRGSTTISSVDGNLGYSGSGSLRSGVLGLGGNVQSGIANIIESLGGTGGAFSVSVGQRGKNFVVDPTGRGRTKGSGVLKFKDEADAIRAAILDAINDGAVQGIRAGAQRLLRAGTDLDKALQKAVKFQSVFDRLDALKDPIGSALRSLNREFTGLISVFNEAGASAEEFAQLEELYGLERARLIKETTEQMSGALKQLIDDLKMGDNGLDLRTRLSNARAVFDPLAATIRSGGTVDYDAFAEAARTLLDLQRQIDGSQLGYFSTFNEVLGLSETALARQQAAIAAATGTGSPFTSTTASNDNTVVVSAIGGQTTALLGALNLINSNLVNLSWGTMSANLGGNDLFRTSGAVYF